MGRPWKQRRSYDPSAPLFARQNLKFSGRQVKQGEMIPAEYLDREKHRRLWRVGHADHAPRTPYSRMRATEPELAAATPTTKPRRPRTARPE